MVAVNKKKLKEQIESKGKAKKAVKVEVKEEPQVVSSQVSWFLIVFPYPNHPFYNLLFDDFS